MFNLEGGGSCGARVRNRWESLLQEIDKVKKKDHSMCGVHMDIATSHHVYLKVVRQCGGCFL